MRRSRIGKEAFEGLLWLQQQDAQRAQDAPKPKRKKLALPENTGVGVPSIFQAAQGVVLPAHNARADRANTRYRNAHIVSDPERCVQGISATFSSWNSLGRAMAAVPESTCLYVIKQSFYGEDFYEREIGRLTRMRDVPSDVVAACPRADFAASVLVIFNSKLPRRESDMAVYFMQSYGAAPGIKLDSPALEEPLVLLRPAKYMSYDPAA